MESGGRIPWRAGLTRTIIRTEFFPGLWYLKKTASMLCSRLWGFRTASCSWRQKKREFLRRQLIYKNAWPFQQAFFIFLKLNTSGVSPRMKFSSAPPVGGRRKKRRYPERKLGGGSFNRLKYIILYDCIR